jgi:DnaA family protein
MQQLALALLPHPEASFANFVPGRNAEALAVLQRLARGCGTERFVYLWGEEGSGRSHLLHAVAREADAAGRRAVHLEASASGAAWDAVEANDVLTIGGADKLDAAAQEALFAAYNRIREGTGCLVVSAHAAPRGLSLRSDLATRLAWGLVYELHPLSEDDKLEAMRARARTLGFDLPPEIQGYVLRHSRRDLPSLLKLIDLVDQHSLQTQRMVTLPLVREVLAMVGAEEADERNEGRGAC